MTRSDFWTPARTERLKELKAGGMNNLLRRSVRLAVLRANNGVTLGRPEANNRGRLN